MPKESPAVVAPDLDNDLTTIEIAASLLGIGQEYVSALVAGPVAKLPGKSPVQVALLAQRFNCDPAIMTAALRGEDRLLTDLQTQMVTRRTKSWLWSQIEKGNADFAPDVYVPNLIARWSYRRLGALPNSVFVDGRAKPARHV